MIDAATLWDLVAERAAATPEREFLVDEGGRSLTFGAFRDLTEEVAAGLHARGISEGTVVSWQLPTWIEAAVLVAALSRLGAVQNPMVPIYRHREVGFILDQLDPAIYIGTSTWRDFDYQAMVAELAPGLDRLTVEPSTEGIGLPTGDPASLPPPPVAPGDPADQAVRYIYYTSGTTSDPKGARHTEANVLHGAVINTTGVGLLAEDTVIMIFPFTHVGGTVILESVLQMAARLVLTDAFVPDRTSELIKRLGVTVAPGATPIHQAFVAVNRARPDEKLFETVRVFPSGGAPMPPALFYEVKDELDSRGIVSGYGLTEAPLLTMGRTTDTDEQLSTTEGRPGPGVELRFLREDGSECGPGEEGEIRARGPQIMKGYYDSSLDAAAFDADGWFRTGDLGHRDADGYVTISGRLKDVIIRKAENVSAQEVENTLYTHSKVGDVAVIGLPDENTGERVCAVVVTAEGEDPLTFDEMTAHCKAAGLMMQKVPEQLEIVDALPRNNTGKVMKFVLKEQFS
ncbi:MAG: AMP-binding protein [Acidimicrobiia bacterium]|nr:AMP-binding protein [Acidimicrobiia bacterium]